MIPINLNRRSLGVGMRPGGEPFAPPNQAPPMPQPQGNPARSAALADVLGDPVSVESGGWGEAVAEALAQGLRGRALQSMYQREMDQQEATASRTTQRENASDQRAQEMHDAELAQMRAELLAADGGGDWEVGSGYTHAFRVRPDGTVQQGGEIPLRPRAPNSRGPAAPPVPEGFILD